MPDSKKAAPAKKAAAKTAAAKKAPARKKATVKPKPAEQVSERVKNPSPVEAPVQVFKRMKAEARVRPVEADDK